MARLDTRSISSASSNSASSSRTDLEGAVHQSPAAVLGLLWQLVAATHMHPHTWPPKHRTARQQCRRQLPLLQPGAWGKEKRVQLANHPSQLLQQLRCQGGRGRAPAAVEAGVVGRSSRSSSSSSSRALGTGCQPRRLAAQWWVPLASPLQLDRRGSSGVGAFSARPARQPQACLPAPA